MFGRRTVRTKANAESFASVNHEIVMLAHLHWFEMLKKYLATYHRAVGRSVTT